ncbi:hypothetical protein [Variovorax sp. KK3]|uniref:hypothetical protein n=1 Tax=Variovorax sp. KK3 TaxID=1855728 RepID=UPI00097C06D4|nr:hypothetical protein [Variovorax sp. KK3]
MTFQTKLFMAIAAADETLCNGSLVTSKLLDAGGALPPFVDLADGSTVNIQDGVISIDDEGRAYAEQGGEPIVWRFRAMQPLTAQNVPTIDPPRLKVSEVVDRLRVRGNNNPRGPRFG